MANIARIVGVSRQTTYRYLHMMQPPARRPRRFVRRERCLAPYEEYLRRRWAEGCHNGLGLWREIRAMGFAYSANPVSRFVAQLRRDATCHRVGHLAASSSEPVEVAERGERPELPRCDRVESAHSAQCPEQNESAGRAG